MPPGTPRQKEFSEMECLLTALFFELFAKLARHFYDCFTPPLVGHFLSSHLQQSDMVGGCPYESKIGDYLLRFNKQVCTKDVVCKCPRVASIGFNPNFAPPIGVLFFHRPSTGASKSLQPAMFTSPPLPPPFMLLPMGPLNAPPWRQPLGLRVRPLRRRCTRSRSILSSAFRCSNRSRRRLCLVGVRNTVLPTITIETKVSSSDTRSPRIWVSPQTYTSNR